MKEQISAAIAAVCQELFDLEPVVQLERPEPQYGDWATNVAMHMARELGRNPREIAPAIATKLQNNEMFKEVGVAGPGFINMTMHDELLARQMYSKPSQPLHGLKILVEYSDPNPFKPLHAGHLYSTLVGDVIARLIESAGADIVRLNYGGDVGLHVGRCIWSIIRSLGGEFPDKLQDVAESDRAKWMGQRYAEGYAAYEDDEQAQLEIVAMNKKVYELHETQDKESNFAQIYWACRGWSYTYFQDLYTQLEVHPFDRFIPESEVTPLGLTTVNEQLAAGVFERSDGAVVFKGEDVGLHTRVFINSAGLPTYETKDVGLSLTKWRDYAYDESIIITADEQAQYMQVIVAAIAKFAPELAERTRHITHGMVKLSGRVKMSSRKGNAVLALEILDEARNAAANSERNIHESSILAAVKYSFLKNRIGSDIIYNPDESVSLEGNSGPYLQYAHARACSILCKVGVDIKEEFTGNFDEQERLLARALSEYSETIDSATLEIAPHLICTYLYELSQVFNRFYEKSQVIDNDRSDIRLLLVARYQRTLQNGLTLLGITAPESM